MPETRTRGYATPFSTTGSLTLCQMNDVKVENFRDRMIAGELINNPMTRSLYTCTGPSVYTRGTNVYKRYVSTGGIYFTSYVSHICPKYLVRLGSSYTILGIKDQAVNACIKAGLTDITANEENLLNTQIDAKLGSGIAQLYVTLAEGKKTLNMLARALHLLRRPLSDAKNILRLTRAELRTDAGRRRLLDKAGDLWLEGRYGWRPFVFEVMGFTQALLEGGRPARYSVRGKMGRSGTFSVPNLVKVSSSGLGAFGINVDVTCTYKCRVGTTADYKISFQDKLGTLIGLYDPLGSAWELVKYSFVLDWFLNIGDILQSLQTYALVDQRIAWVTRDMEVTAKHTSFQPSPSSMYTSSSFVWYDPLPPSIGYEERILVRTRTPRLSFLPALGYRFNMDFAKVIDLAFLLKKAMGTR